MKDKLNRFMQGRYGVDNFARFTLGVALFVIVVGSFMRQNAAGGVLDTVGFILIIYTYFRILSNLGKWIHCQFFCFYFSETHNIISSLSLLCTLMMLERV